MDPVEAFLAIPVAAICCDGHIGDEEAVMLKQRLLHQAPRLGLSGEELDRIVEGLQGSPRMENWQELVMDAALVLTAQQREKAFILAVQLVYSDRNVALEEHCFVDLLAAEMGLSVEWSEGILAMFGILRRQPT